MADIERIDAALTKLDAVRYALPAILAAVSSSSTASSSNEERLAIYTNRLKQADSSIDEFERSAAALNGLLDALKARDDYAKITASGSYDRLRRDPYTFKQTTISSLKGPKTTWDNVSYPITSISNAVNAVEKLISLLSDRVSKYPVLEIQAMPTKDNKGLFTITIKECAKVFVFLKWSADVPVFQRFNIVGAKEDKRAYESSDFALWRNISLEAGEAYRKHAETDSLNVDCLFSLLAAYASPHGDACSSDTCQRILHQHTLLPPTTRAYQAARLSDQSANSDKSKTARWLPYHPQCLPSTG